MVPEIYLLDTDRQTAGQRSGIIKLLSVSYSMKGHLCCQYNLKLDEQSAEEVHYSMLTAERKNAIHFCDVRVDVRVVRKI